MQSGRSSCLTPAHHRLVKSARGQNSPNRQGKILPEEDNGFSRGKSKLLRPPHIVGRLGGRFDEHDRNLTILMLSLLKIDSVFIW